LAGGVVVTTRLGLGGWALTAAATAAAATTRTPFLAGREDAGLASSKHAQHTSFALLDYSDLNLVASRAEPQQSLGDGLLDGGRATLYLFRFVVVLHQASAPPAAGALVCTRQLWYAVTAVLMVQ